MAADSLGEATIWTPKRVMMTAPRAAMIRRKGTSQPTQLSTGMPVRAFATRVSPKTPSPAEKAGCQV